MPLLDRSAMEDPGVASESTGALTENKENAGEENSQPTESGDDSNATEWLASMGLKTDQFPSLQQHQLIL